jgi:hypothetical protein
MLGFLPGSTLTIVCPQGVLFRGQPEVEDETDEFDDSPEIALDCGYPASSLKERVYALSGPDGAPERCGILIYTAAPHLDSTHRVDSLRCEGSDAIGAKRTCQERRERVDLTKMTHLRHGMTKFAVMQNAVFPTTVW